MSLLGESWFVGLSFGRCIDGCVGTAYTLCVATRLRSDASKSWMDDRSLCRVHEIRLCECGTSKRVAVSTSSLVTPIPLDVSTLRVMSRSAVLTIVQLGCVEMCQFVDNPTKRCLTQMWNVDTGECLRTFEGHYHQIYAVAFDGLRVATGSLDSTVRVWNPESGYVYQTFPYLNPSLTPPALPANAQQCYQATPP